MTRRRSTYSYSGCSVAAKCVPVAPGGSRLLGERRSATLRSRRTAPPRRRRAAARTGGRARPGHRRGRPRRRSSSRRSRPSGADSTRLRFATSAPPACWSAKVTWSRTTARRSPLRRDQRPLPAELVEAERRAVEVQRRLARGVHPHAAATVVELEAVGERRHERVPVVTLASKVRRKASDARQASFSRGGMTSAAGSSACSAASAASRSSGAKVVFEASRPSSSASTRTRLSTSLSATAPSRNRVR